MTKKTLASSAKRSAKVAPRPAARPASTASGEMLLDHLPSNDALTRAVLARISGAMRQVLHSADREMLQRVIAAPTDIGVMARVANESAASQEAVGELDPLASLFAKGAEQKMELLRRCGSTLSVTEVAEVLGISRQAVDKRRRESKLLAVPRGADYAFPACQFDEGQVIPGLPELLAPLLDRPWTALAFLATPLEELAERTPLEVLKSKDAAAKDLALRLARIAGGEGFG
jgi:hypothetical protein